MSANESDSNGGNDSAYEPTAVRAKADVAVTSKTALIASPPLQYGQIFQWQVVVTNNGPGDAYGTTLSDSLPANMELVLPLAYSISAGGGTCSNTGVTQLSCAIGTVTPSNSVTVTFDVVIRKPSSGGVPTSYTNTASVSTDSVDLVSPNNSNSGSVNLVKSSIAGTVYTDDDNDGAIDGTEIGIGSVTLTLTGQDVFGNAVNRSVQSAANGTYLFDNLEQANATGYTITQTQLPAYSDGLETAGTAASGTPPGGTVAATIGSQTITNIVLDKEQIATGYNFGELRLNSLAGTVFADVGNDGAKGASDPGIQNVSVKLIGTDVRGNSVDLDVLTSSTGAYSFSNVLPGTYELIETQLATHGDGIDTAGNLSGNISVNDHISAIAVAHTNGTGYDFAEQPGSISGRVYHDQNRNDAFDGGDAGLVGVQINLSGTDTRRRRHAPDQHSSERHLYIRRSAGGHIHRHRNAADRLRHRRSDQQQHCIDPDRRERR